MRSLLDRPPQRRPRRPGAARLLLPDVVEVLVAPASKELETAVLVDADAGVRRQGAAERLPGRPASAVLLPHMEDLVVRAPREDLEASVGVLRHGNLRSEVPTERLPRGPRARRLDPLVVGL